MNFNSNLTLKKEKRNHKEQLQPWLENTLPTKHGRSTGKRQVSHGSSTYWRVGSSKQANPLRMERASAGERELWNSQYRTTQCFMSRVGGAWWRAMATGQAKQQKEQWTAYPRMKLLCFKGTDVPKKKQRKSTVWGKFANHIYSHHSNPGEKCSSASQENKNAQMLKSLIRMANKLCTSSHVTQIL